MVVDSDLDMGDDCKDRGQRYYTAASHVTCHRPICMYVVFIFSCSRLDSIRLPPCPGTDLPTPGDSCKSCFRICVLSHRDIAPLSNKCFKAAVFLYGVTLVSSRYRNHWQVRHSTTAEKPFLPPTRRSSSSSRRKSSRSSSILSPCGVHDVKCQLQTRHLQHGRVRRPPKRPRRVLSHLHVPRVLFAWYVALSHRRHCPLTCSQVDIPPSQVHILDGNVPDLVAECNTYEAAIKSYGGIELFLGGIGEDGHIAFNEPGPSAARAFGYDVTMTRSSLASRTRIKTLVYDTILANARFFENDISKVPGWPSPSASPPFLIRAKSLLSSPVNARVLH